jgi:dihydroorotate dehydrogenase
VPNRTAVGGIETAEDAWERLAVGATLVQAYTAFIYQGPLWPHCVQAALATRMRGSRETKPPAWK